MNPLRCSLTLLAAFLCFANHVFAQIRFKEVTREAGLYEPLSGIMGHGGAFGDYDGDGLIDLYVGGFCDRPNDAYEPAKGPVPNRLFRNLGNGKFQRVREDILEFYARTSGAVFADLDNDGKLELYVANNTKGRSSLKVQPQRDSQLRHSNLFRFDGKKWIDITKSSGACPESLGTARNIGVFDYNQDGLLDLLLVEDRFTRNPRSVLLRNRGNLQFEDVTKAVGLPNDLFGLGLAVADLNEDGRPDFFIAHSNRLFLSTKEGRYVEPASLRKLFAWQPLDNEDWPCGAAFGDLNRDGRLDLVVGIHHEKARNRIYLNEGLNNGVPQFRDVSIEAGMPAQLPNKSPHVEIQDFDNDGWPDIYFSTAWLDKDGSVTVLTFRNEGVKNGVPRFKAPRAIGEAMVYYPAGPSGDYDNDGRIDLFLINWFRGNHCRLLHNISPKRHWLDVHVVGTKMNRMGIGAQVKVYRPGKIGKPEALLGFQEISTGYGYASGQPAYCHFGLGNETKADVRVKLPDGRVIDKLGVAADQKLIVHE
ncbi:MAG: hypothetical protein KatS3mg105_1755 [Gemmatales bacterium]|nr:MAG: hypothetical protein KatS3mg105_1755 [Gemmatales bacterium]